MTTVATAAAGGRAEELPRLNEGVTGYISDYFTTLKALIDAVEPAEIERVVSLLLETFQAGRRLVMCGNGGSGSTASHLVCDFAKNVYLETGRSFEVVALTDSPALITAWANDTEYAEIFAGQARTWLRADDVLIAISGSGNSPQLSSVLSRSPARSGRYRSAFAGMAAASSPHSWIYPSSWIGAICSRSRICT